MQWDGVIVTHVRPGYYDWKRHHPRTEKRLLSWSLYPTLQEALNEEQSVIDGMSKDFIIRKGSSRKRWYVPTKSLT